MKENIWDYIDELNMNFNVRHETGMPMYLHYNTD